MSDEMVPLLEDVLEDISAEHDIPMPGFYTTAKYLAAALHAKGLALVPAETAKVGEAVLRLPDYYTIEQDNGLVNVNAIVQDEFVYATDATLPAAIDAALRGPQA